MWTTRDPVLRSKGGDKEATGLVVLPQLLQLTADVVQAGDGCEMVLTEYFSVDV
jgi:hypothetical protein